MAELRVGWDGTQKIVPWDKFLKSVPWDGITKKKVVPPWDGMGRKIFRPIPSHPMGHLKCQIFFKMSNLFDYHRSTETTNYNTASCHIS